MRRKEIPAATVGVPSSLAQATSGTDTETSHQQRSRRRLSMILLGLAAASCLAVAGFAAALLWRSAQTPSAAVTSTPTVARGATRTLLPPALDVEGPAQGGLTDPELKAQVWSTIMSFYANVRGCNDVSSDGIRVSQQPDATGSWEETWEVSACAEAATLKIRFTAAPDGGFFYDIME